MSESIFEIPVTKIDRTPTTLNEFKGKTLLIVNVASKCGYTFHYTGLEEIWNRYKEQGLVILGFPVNDFGAQEPGTEEEIQQFCSTTYSVTFPLFSKIVATGPNKHPLYKVLTEAQPVATANADSPLVEKLLAGGYISEVVPGEVLWNFEKFLVRSDGEVVARFAADVKPEDPMIVDRIEELLGEAVSA